MNELNEQFEIEEEAEAHANRIENGDARHRLAIQMLKQTRDSLNHVINLLEDGDTSRATRHMVDLVTNRKGSMEEFESESGAAMIEGVFDGQTMVGADGISYPIPENYASKSQLVEGDMLKLFLRPDGTHVFKQIGPVDRQRVVGKLEHDSQTAEYVVIHDDSMYKVLDASVSYHKGVPGDEVAILIPKGGKSRWAAVERIINL